MKFFVPLLLTLAVALSASATYADNIITRELIRSKNKDRVYYLYVPDKLDKTKPVPLLVLLHGSGRNGISLVEKWKELAKKEQFIIVGADATNSQGWAIPADGPDFIHELVDALETKYPINARRVYLFGHSAGAGQSLYLSMLESEYFAAAAIHAGSFREKDYSWIDGATRKIPIAIWVGTEDPLFPVSVVRATRDALVKRGFKAELTEVKGHTHDYYSISDEINKGAWAFLKQHELSEDPKYDQINFK